VKVLFVGDIIGSPGRLALSRYLPELKARGEVDCCIVNGENAAGGFGLTREVSTELFDLGVDVITGGNHLWDKREIHDFISLEPRIVRPANYPEGTPGAGSALIEVPNGKRLAVLNLLGRVFMPAVDCPFRTADALLPGLRRVTPLVVVDVHAEATSEKVAMGWYLDGRVSAVVGTHTHVQTADERVLPRGTAYMTDVGMTGPHDSVIGVRRDVAIKRFLTQLPIRFQTAKGDPRLCAALVDIDDDNGRAVSIKRIQRRV
jgi:metallophosphoesterase (TIGR00282 family)